MDINYIKKLSEKATTTRYDWTLHVNRVIYYALELAKGSGADRQVLEVASILHDIGRYKYGGKDHDITGSREARKILEQQDCSKDFINQVCYCIENHSSSTSSENKISKELEILRNADALAHFDAVLYWFFTKGDKGEEFEKAIDWVKSKLAEDWDTKISMPKARELIESSYKSIQLLISNAEKCLNQTTNFTKRLE